MEEVIKRNREFMKSNFVSLSDITTDQKSGIPFPNIKKEIDSNEIIKLPEFSQEIISQINFLEIVKNRKSRREYNNHSMSLEELSFLLWSTQGVKEIVRGGIASFRTVPSGGARHPFETYLVVQNVDSLKQGLYRYLPFENSLLFIEQIENIKENLSDALKGQKWSEKSSVCFFWTCIPYRSEWRYSIASHKTMLLDAGHICQNLYLACESIGYGTCAIAAYDQIKSDKLLKVDGENEFTVYISPVGK
ncbi:MAG: SagB/ThcOx family dehydrogenase [Candidatus Delongbacteria bacterium]|nr:SagB/ThcOx family dehydrogenase [Candidatus Delongbacteria bacterium]MBN2836568.1 SagB/ThcOx family dehydrogenase [Candidatus Delongbacteria bacterium]